MNSIFEAVMKTLLPLFVALVLAVGNAANAATINWTNTAGGNWNTAANWNPNQVPVVSDDAVITAVGTYAVILDTSPIVKSLTLGGSSGQQTLTTGNQNLSLSNASVVNANGVLELASILNSSALTIKGQLNWSGGRIDAGSVVTVATNGVLTTSGAGYLELSGTLTNAGTLRLVGGLFRCIDYGGYGGGGGQLVNLPGGLIDVQADVAIHFYNDNSGGVTPAIFNQGTLRKSGGTNQTDIMVPLYSSGKVDVQSGTVSIQGGGVNSGTFTNTASTTLVFPASYEQDGVLAGPGNVLSGGILTGTNGLITGTLKWTGGQMGVGSILKVATNGVLVLAGGGVYLENSGILTNAGTIQAVSGIGLRLIDYGGYGGGIGRLVNLPGALIDVQADVWIYFYNDNSGGGTPSLINQGTLRKSGGNGVSFFSNQTGSDTFYNSGTLDVQTGTISVNVSGSGNGIFRAGTGASLAFAADYEVDSALTGAGTNFLGSGTFTLNGTLATSNSVMNGATLSGTNGIISSAMTWFSGRTATGSILTLATNCVLTVVGNTTYDLSGILTNAGTIKLVTGTFRGIDYAGYGGGTGLLVNLPGALIDFQGDVPLVFYNDSSGGGTPGLINQGTLRKSGGTGTSYLQSQAGTAIFVSSGIMDAQSGTLINYLPGQLGGTLIAEAGATLNFAANYTPDTGTVITGAGTNVWSAGTFTLNNCSITASNLVLGGAVLSGTNGVIGAGSRMLWTSGSIAAGSALTIASNAVLLVGGAYNGYNDLLGALTNAGTIQLTNNSYLRCYGGQLINLPNALVDLQDDSQLWYAGLAGEAVINQGTIRKSGGSGLSYIVPAFSNSGTLDVQHGTIYVNGAFTLTGGKINFGISGVVDYGKVWLSTPSALDGAFSVNLNPGYSPVAGNTFAVLKDGAVTGGFTSITLPSKITWGTNFDGNVLTLIVSNVAPTLPAITNQAVNELVTLTLTNGASDPDIARRKIIGISIPVGSMNGSAYPANDGVWSVHTPPYPINENAGIGYLINPATFSSGSLTLFDNQYSNNVPDPANASVTYEFETPVTITDLQIVQYIYGISQIEGFVGNTTNAMTSIGSVFGPWGDTSAVFTEGQLYNFHFTNSLAGKYFRFVIRKTPQAAVYGVYRAFPIGGSGNDYVAAISPPNTVSYALLTAPVGAAIDTNGTITWTPTEAQGPVTNTFTTLVTDNGSPAMKDTNTFSVVVNEINTPPVLPVQVDRNIDELTSLTVTNTATDSDIPINPLTYALAVAPPNAAISTNGIITWTPTEAQGPGSYTFTTIVTDTNPPAVNTKSLTATNSFNVTVNEINVAPVLNVPASAAINELALYTNVATATDADLPANPLTFALVSGPPGLTVSTTGAIAWTPTEAQGPGVYTVSVSVTDTNPPAVNAKSLSVTNSFILTVNELNAAPVLTVPATQTINELTTLTVTNTATDADIPANTLTFSLVSVVPAPTGAVALNPTNGVLTYSPSEADGPVTNVFTIRVTDYNPTAINTSNLTDTKSFSVIVNEVNSAPVLPLQTNLTINELTTLTVTNTATDSDLPTNTLTYTFLVAPAGAVISANGIITWTTVETNGPGTNTFTTKVTDNGTPNLSATNTFTVIVNEVNSAPVLGTLLNPTINPGQTVSFTATATDSDVPANTLTFSLISSPAGATLDSASGLFNWRAPIALANTTNVVQVRVTDYNPIAVNTTNLTDTKSFNIIVNPLSPVVLTPLGYAGGQFVLKVNGTAGPDYILSTSTNLTVWSDLITNLSPATPFQFTNASSANNRFYRVRLAP
jgi:hypothetical protein